MAKVPYNKGDEYEDRIFKILEERRLMPDGAKRAGAGTGTDMVFIHKGKKLNLEVKKDLHADFGQKYFKWDKNNGWSWAIDDKVTKFYTNLGVLEFLNKKGIVPIKFSKSNKQIMFEDKKRDQKIFKDNIYIPIEALYKYYEIKDCFYMQIGKGFGFYYLKKDLANLGTPQFGATLKLRFRAKTIHSKPVWNYRFLVALKIQLSKEKQKVILKPSLFNLESSKTQRFPPINP